MDQLEATLRSHAYYGISDTLTEVELDNIIDLNHLKFIGQGMNARVFRLLGTDWVVKEGRWDLGLEFLGKLKLKFPAQITQDFLANFNLTFLPEPSEIIRQYRQYLMFIRYFGFFTDANYFHPDLKKMISFQQAIRRQLKKNTDLIETKYYLSLPPQFHDMFTAEVLATNFLPQEYLLYAPSISSQNQHKPTYFIFQRFIDGKPLSELDPSSATPLLIRKLVLFAYLCLYIQLETGMVPDVRPDDVSKTIDWFGQTDNVRFTPKDVYMVDTRWFWQTTDNLVRRGGIIPELVTFSTRNYLLQLVRNYV